MHNTFKIFEALVADLDTRVDALHGLASAKVLAEADTKRVIELSSQHVTMGIISREKFVSTVSKIGSSVMMHLGLTRDTPKAINIGCFVLETFVNVGLVNKTLRTETGERHSAYYVVSDDRQGLSDLVRMVGPDKMDSFPSAEPFADWESGIHHNGLPLVRHAPINLLKQINSDEHHEILDSVNTLQNTAWAVNPRLLDVMETLIKLGDAPKVLPHQDESKPKDTRSSLRLEVDMIRLAAEKVGEEPFYHQYNTCFRGRVYPTTSFLNEQSSDRSKGMLMYAQGQEVTEDGLKWLLVHAANCWGNDKITLVERELFSMMNIDMWRDWADHPIEFRGWMEADKPWSFLAAITELVRTLDDPDYLCHLPIFIDGSNNGVQHMAALARDEPTAALVNVTPTELPGDVYMFIKDAVYAQIEQDYNPDLDADFLAFQAKSMDFDVRISATKGPERKVLITEANEFRKEAQPKKYAPNFFMAITDKKTQRKLVKRPVMTLGYGGTRNGFKNQIIEDTKQMGPKFRSMSHSWAAYFGDLIYFTSRGGPNQVAQLPGLAQMLDLFEGLASKAMDEDRKLCWKVPVTNFPVVQQYKKPMTRVVKVTFMGQRLELNATIFEDTVTNKRKQKTSASPNIVHSFDAAHLQLTINACDFGVTTIHDSFGCHPSDMGELFHIVREEFVRFYQADPLQNLLAQQNAIEMMPPRGNLDVTGILESEFAFV